MAAKKKTPTKKKNFDFFNNLETGNKIADGNVKIETKEFIDTESYSFNAVLSGDMTKGFPSNRILMAAGAESVGKSFIAMYNFCKPLIERGYFIFFIDSESSMTEEGIEEFGIPKGQYKLIPQDVIENLRLEVNRILNQIEEKRGRKNINDDDFKCAFVLDSQGQLDTMKSRSDADKGKTTTDLTFQKELKKFYKTVTTRMGILNIPFFVTNHIYKDNMSIFPKTVVSGGQGGLYASSIICHFRKKEFKEGSVRTGTILTGKIYKSRFCKEKIEASMYLNFEKGFNKWYGIHEFALEADLIEKMAKSQTAIKAYEKKGYKLPEGFSDGGYILIKDPKKEEKDWLIIKENSIHKESAIGTIFDEINEWVKDNFKLTRPVDFSYEEEEEDLEKVITGDVTEETSEEDIDMSTGSVMNH